MTWIGLLPVCVQYTHCTISVRLAPSFIHLLGVKYQHGNFLLTVKKTTLGNEIVLTQMNLNFNSMQHSLFQPQL